MATKKNEEAKQELITVDPSRYAVGEVIDYGDYAGSGMDDITLQETGIPFLKIINDDCAELKDGTVPADALGKLFNSGTQEVVDELLIVPAVRQHVFAEWIPRKKGGGMVGLHTPDSAVVAAAKAASNEFGKYQTEAGNDLVETFYVYAVTLDPKTEDPTGMIVIPFASSGIKVYSKRLVGRMRPVMVAGPNGSKVRPPMFAHRVVIGSFLDKNKTGDEWYNYSVRFAIDNNPVQSLTTQAHPGFQAGAQLAEMVNAGTAKADLSTAGEGATSKPAADGGSAF